MAGSVHPTTASPPPTVPRTILTRQERNANVQQLISELADLIAADPDPLHAWTETMENIRRSVLALLPTRTRSSRRVED